MSIPEEIPLNDIGGDEPVRRPAELTEAEHAALEHVRDILEEDDRELDVEFDQSETEFRPVRPVPFTKVERRRMDAELESAFGTDDEPIVANANAVQFAKRFYYDRFEKPYMTFWERVQRTVRIIFGRQK